MDHERMAFVAGWSQTRAAIARWRSARYRIVWSWLAVSTSIGMLLLVATWIVAVARPDASTGYGPAFSHDPTWGGVGAIFRRNLLVLVMHALICVAGFMATSSMPIVAEGYSGVSRRLHLLARPITVAFVLVVTIASISLQAYSLGSAAPAVAAHYGMSVPELLLRIAPHAVPELAAVFLPLGAWMVLARRHAWNELLAASIVSTTVALPLLAASAAVEEWVTPHIMTW